MKNIALVWTMIVTLSCSSFAQSPLKRPTKLPPKTVKSRTLDEPPLMAAPSGTAIDSRLASSREETTDKTKQGSFFFRKPEGYPQQQIALLYVPTWFRSKWSFHDTEFKFDPVASDSFGLSYRYLLSPSAEAELTYRQFSLQLNPDTADTGLNLNESRQYFESIRAHFEYSWIGAERYFYSYGLGLEVGQDRYPTLAFTDASTVQLQQARDLIVGLSVQSQLFLLQPFSYKFKVGYDFGLHPPHLGGPDTKKNHSYYADIGLEYMINEQSSLTADAEYRVRNSTSSGKKGDQEAEWDTDSQTTQIQLAYVFTFR